MTTKVLVCDDETDGFRQTKKMLDLDGGCKIRRLVGADLRQAVKALFEEVQESLSDQANRHALCSVSKIDTFDDIDVAIVDNNLWALDFEGLRLTAEALIGYLRAFTNIPYIVSLNKNPDVDFDLRFMVGDYQTHADFALNTEHLRYGVLWRDELKNGELETDVFAPSYWPNIHRVARLRRELVDRVEADLGKAVLDVLDFPPTSLEVLSRHAKGFISPNAETDQDLRDIKCIDFFKTSCRSLPQRDRDILFDRAQGGDPSARSSVARSVAANLDKWLRRMVLGPQDVLIDLPHLLSRMPFLLGKGAADLKSWNGAIYGASLSNSMWELAREAEYETPGIYTRWPCFWWSSLRENSRLDELFFGCEDEWADVMFCEDVSRFVESPHGHRGRDGDVVEEPKEFEAEFGGGWSRRYVRVVDGVQYSPRSRLAI